MIVRKRKDDPVLPRGKSSDVKLKMIELDRNIGHNSVMSIREFFIDRDEPAHLVDQVIHDMEGIGDTSAEGGQSDGSVVRGGFFGRWICRALSIGLYAFSSWIGMWNRLVTPSVDDREGMDGGGEGTSAKEDNRGREWLSAAAMTVDRGVMVGL